MVTVNSAHMADLSRVTGYYYHSFTPISDNNQMVWTLTSALTVPHSSWNIIKYQSMQTQLSDHIWCLLSSFLLTLISRVTRAYFHLHALLVLLLLSVTSFFCFTPSSCQRQLSRQQQCISFFLFTPSSTNMITVTLCVTSLLPTFICQREIHLQPKLLISFYKTFHIYMPFLFPSRLLWFYKLLWTDIKSQTWILLSGI